MRNFTKTEIDLCKKIAEKEKKKIEQGDWYYSIDMDGISYYYKIDPEMEPESHIIPLWQEHDCLEFLTKNGWRLVCLTQKRNNGKFNILIKKGFKLIDKPGDTMLECWQSAVLAVMDTMNLTSNNPA